MSQLDRIWNSNAPLRAAQIIADAKKKAGMKRSRHQAGGGASAGKIRTEKEFLSLGIPSGVPPSTPLQLISRRRK
jgi:hypothetical protein